jgi:hypothetical protein
VGFTSVESIDASGNGRFYGSALHFLCISAVYLQLLFRLLCTLRDFSSICGWSFIQIRLTACCGFSSLSDPLEMFSCVSCVWWIVAFVSRQETIHESTRNITNCNLDTKIAGSIEILTADSQRTDSLSNRAIGSPDENVLRLSGASLSGR